MQTLILGVFEVTAGLVQAQVETSKCVKACTVHTDPTDLWTMKSWVNCFKDLWKVATHALKLIWWTWLLQKEIAVCDMVCNCTFAKDIKNGLPWSFEAHIWAECARISTKSLTTHALKHQYFCKSWFTETTNCVSIHALKIFYDVCDYSLEHLEFLQFVTWSS